MTDEQRKIYVASSWRNERQPSVVKLLRQSTHLVYDFRNPPTCAGFDWSEIDKDWKYWTAEEFRAALNHPFALRGYRSDFDAMQWADTCVLVLPCGRSAHLEAGFMAGQGKAVHVLLDEDSEPELMYRLVYPLGVLCLDEEDLLAAIHGAI